jgi:hypothetical protein
MKTLFSLLFIFSLTILSAQTTEEKEIQNIVENFFEDVFTKLEETKLNQYVTQDVILFENGEIFNLDSLNSYVKNRKEMFNSEENKMHSFDRINQFEFISTQVEKETALITYRIYASFTMNGTEIAKMKWLESINLRKTTNGWKIYFLHSTEIKND